MSFRLNATYLFLTYPCQSAPAEELLAFLKTKLKNMKFCRIAEEVHNTTLELHLHAFVQLTKRCDFTRASCLDFKDKHGDYKACIDPDGSYKYLSGEIDGHPKEGWIRKLDFGEYVSPKLLKKQGELEAKERIKERNKLLIETESKELVDTGEVSLMELPKLLKAKEEYSKLILPPMEINRDCYWFYGEPGTGKSYHVRKLEPSLYEKNPTKWWCNYKNEPAIILDDFDLQSGKELSHEIKIWADNYRFLGETKGNSVYPIYTRLYVTSNYLPHQIWDGAKDMALLGAITRRFKFYTVKFENGKRTKTDRETYEEIEI